MQKRTDEGLINELYLMGKTADELFVVVTTVAFVNDAKKFDVNCDARALMSIDETVISGPTRLNRFQ